MWIFIIWRDEKFHKYADLFSPDKDFNQSIELKPEDSVENLFRT